MNDIPKTKKTPTWAVVLCMVVGIPALIFGCKFYVSEDSNTSTPSQSKTEFKVENVRIEKELSNAWAVKGMIRNVGSTDIKGSVKIKFLNSNGDITQSVRAYVNDGDPIRPGQGGYFEYYLEPEKFTDIVKFDVIFIESK